MAIRGFDYWVVKFKLCGMECERCRNRFYIKSPRLVSFCPFCGLRGEPHKVKVLPNSAKFADDLP